MAKAHALPAAGIGRAAGPLRSNGARRRGTLESPVFAGAVPEPVEGSEPAKSRPINLKNKKNNGVKKCLKN